MAHSPGANRPGAPKAQGIGLMLVRIGVGVYIFFDGISKAGWLLDSTPFAGLLSQWMASSTSISRWYLDRLMPGAPVLARVLPLAEMAGGLALAVGFWTRLAAALCLGLVLNLQLAAGAMFRQTYLFDASGLPVVGALLGLIIGGGRLPWSVRR